MPSLQTGAELEAARADLMMQLPAELPAKDEWKSDGPQPGVAKPGQLSISSSSVMGEAMTEDELIEAAQAQPCTS